jgi:hypothetical protein
MTLFKTTWFKPQYSNFIVQKENFVSTLGGRINPFSLRGLTARRAILILVLANIILRGLWLFCMHPPQLYDFNWYFTHAVQIAHGQGYRIGSQYTAYWPIGYPFFLSVLFRITGPSVIAGLLTNALLSIAITILVFLMTYRITRKAAVGFAAGAGYSLLPSHIEWNSVLGSEELFTFLLLGSLYMYLRSYQKSGMKWVLVSGLCMGFACDVRPIPALFPVFLFAYELFIEKSSFGQAFRKIFLFAIAMLAGICPVTIRNLVVLHHFVLVSTNGGVNLWQGTKADGVYFWSWDPKVNPLLQAGSNDILENQIGIHTFVTYLIHHPIRAVYHGFLKLFFLYWLDTNVVSVTFQVSTQPIMRHLTRLAEFMNTIAYWFFLAVSLLGITKRNQIQSRVQRQIFLPLTFIIYNTAIFCFFPAWDRFRYPMMPLYAIFFGIGIIYLLSRQRVKD